MCGLKVVLSILGRVFWRISCCIVLYPYLLLLKTPQPEGGASTGCNHTASAGPDHTASAAECSECWHRPHLLSPLPTLIFLSSGRNQRSIKREINMNAELPPKFLFSSFHLLCGSSEREGTLSNCKPCAQEGGVRGKKLDRRQEARQAQRCKPKHAKSSERGQCRG